MNLPDVCPPRSLEVGARRAWWTLDSQQLFFAQRSPCFTPAQHSLGRMMVAPFAGKRRPPHHEGLPQSPCTRPRPPGPRPFGAHASRDFARLDLDGGQARPVSTLHRMPVASRNDVRPPIRAGRAPTNEVRGLRPVLQPISLALKAANSSSEIAPEACRSASFAISSAKLGLWLDAGSSCCASGASPNGTRPTEVRERRGRALGPGSSRQPRRRHTHHRACAPSRTFDPWSLSRRGRRFRRPHGSTFETATCPPSNSILAIEDIGRATFTSDPATKVS